MKRIPLEVYYFAGSLRPMVHFLLRSEKPHIFASIRAIVDTGSPTTLIGSSDMERVRISTLQLRKLEGRKKPINIGGGKVYTKVIENAEITFGGSFKIKMSVDFPIGRVKGFAQPSLLGTDFMIKAGARFFFNPSKKEAYFEIDD